MQIEAKVKENQPATINIYVLLNRAQFLTNNLAKRYRSNFAIYLLTVKSLKSIQTLSCANLIYWNPDEYVERKTYRSLKRAWIGYKIAKKDGDHDKMKYYAEGIQKFERQLRLPVSNFSDISKEETENDLDTTKQKEEGGAVTNELSPS